MSHTPGPWFAEYDDNGFYYIRGGEGGLSDLAHIIGEGPLDKANAHLIAAAPDLLEALKVLLSCQLLYIVSTEDSVANAIKGAKVAIAKAEGRLNEFKK